MIFLPIKPLFQSDSAYLIAEYFTVKYDAKTHFL